MDSFLCSIANRHFIYCGISGVKGFILDENNNTLADITLVIVEREFAKFRSSASGTYFRPLLPGTYQIQVVLIGHLIYYLLGYMSVFSLSKNIPDM